MIFYRCYNAHPEGSNWSKTDQKWRVLFSKTKEKVTGTDSISYSLLMHDNGEAVWFWQVVSSKMKHIKKEEMPQACQDVLNSYLSGHETEEI